MAAKKTAKKSKPTPTVSDEPPKAPEPSTAQEPSTDADDLEKQLQESEANESEQEQQPAIPATSLSVQQMDRIKGSPTSALERILAMHKSKEKLQAPTVLHAVKAELEARKEKAARAKLTSPVTHYEVLNDGTIWTPDGFFVTVKKGDTFPVSDKARLEAAKFQLKPVVVNVVRNEMGVPTTVSEPEKDPAKDPPKDDAQS